VSSWSRAGVLAALLALAVGGCRDGEPSKHDSSPPPTPSGPPVGARGIKVPLPPGWAARATPEEALVAGPAGRIVLRIELRPMATGVPSAEALIAGFRERTTAVTVQEVDSKSEPAHSLAVLQVIPAEPTDGGAAAPGWLTLLGAKRLGKDLFLCSTAPGASEDEVKAAAAACGGLERTQQNP